MLQLRLGKSLTQKSSVKQSNISTNLPTMRNGNAQPQESIFTKMMMELERKLCFTDVPCGAMEFKKEQSMIQQKTSTGWLESALCFSDLKDMDGPVTQTVGDC
jgi:hypothetical protein